jgi:hypothetical protein
MRGLELDAEPRDLRSSSGWHSKCSKGGQADGQHPSLQAHDQSAAVAASEHAVDDQAFIDAVSWDASE